MVNLVLFYNAIIKNLGYFRDENLMAANLFGHFCKGKDNIKFGIKWIG